MGDYDLIGPAKRKPAAQAGADTAGEARGRVQIRIATWWRKRWVRVTAMVLLAPAAALCVATVYYYVSFSRLIDQRLHGERDRVLPRIFARPLEIRRGQSMSNRQLIDRLNELGYAQRAKAEKPGEFVDSGTAVLDRPARARSSRARSSGSDSIGTVPNAKAATRRRPSVRFAPRIT